MTTQIRAGQVRGGALTQVQADLLYAALAHQHVEDDVIDLTHSAEALRDVWIADVAPQEGQVLQFVDDQWTPVTFSAGAGALDDLSDVAVAAPSDGQVLAWNAAAQQWQPATVEGGGSSGGAGVLPALFDFQPEFANAIIVPSAVQNGTLQLHDDATARLNAYAWTSSAASEQSVEIVLRWRLPPGFDAWTTPLRVLSKVSQVLSVCAVQVVELLDTAGVNVVASTTRRNETWAEDSIAISGGTWTPEGICTLRFRLYGKAGEVAYLGPVRLGYRVVFGE